ncbi:hypothetical protein Syun_028908 [Stephania yunnanensis]|uniref:Post-GPI attachment to proteins factor 3 n=1 Tax=Stephania yunnanensis TaxID=152371 RepID=A0AAP0ECM7_9MAGN
MGWTGSTVQRFLSFEALGGSLTSEQQGFLFRPFHDEPRKDGDWRLPLIWNASTSLLVEELSSQELRLPFETCVIAVLVGPGYSGMLGDMHKDGLRWQQIAIISAMEAVGLSGCLPILLHDGKGVKEKSKRRRPSSFMENGCSSVFLEYRDVDIAEKLDYSSAVALLGYTLILAILRTFNLSRGVSKWNDCNTCSYRLEMQRYCSSGSGVCGGSGADCRDGDGSGMSRRVGAAGAGRHYKWIYSDDNSGQAQEGLRERREADLADLVTAGLVAATDLCGGAT